MTVNDVLDMLDERIFELEKEVEMARKENEFVKYNTFSLVITELKCFRKEILSKL